EEVIENGVFPHGTAKQIICFSTDQNVVRYFEIKTPTKTTINAKAVSHVGKRKLDSIACRGDLGIDDGITDVGPGLGKKCRWQNSHDQDNRTLSCLWHRAQN